MADPLTSGFTLAGFLLAKSLSVLTGAPCEEALVPMAFVEKEDGQRAIYLFQAKTQEAAVKAGLDAMSKSDSSITAKALVHDGYVNEQGVRTDAFIVRLWVRGQSEPVYLVQTWRRQAAHCEVAALTRIAETKVIVKGVPTSLTSAQMQAVESGIQLNDVVAATWQASRP